MALDQRDGAWAFNTPFKMWKRYNFEGGVADPLLISWPRQIKARGELRHQFAHATDLVPTVYDCIGLELPEVVKGFPQIPLEGVSLRSTFASDDVPTPKETGFFSMLGSRAIWHKGWKAVSVHPTIAGWSNFASDRWELYHTDQDPTETHDLAAEHPVKLQEMISLWFHEAGRYRGLPLEDRTAVEVLADQPVLPAESKANAWIGCVGLLMTAVFVSGIVLRPQHRRLGLGLDSWIALVVYALGIWGLVVVSA